MHLLEFFPAYGPNMGFFGGTTGENLISALKICVYIMVPFLGISLWYLFKSKKSDKIHKLMAVTDPIPIGSMTPGPVEIQGRVFSAIPPAPSPWSQKYCVFYHFYVEEWVVGKDTGYWGEYISDTSGDPFFVQDETGAVEIIPSEGEFRMEMDHFTTSGYFNDAPENLRALLNERYGKDTKGFLFKKKLRYTERILENDDEVYVFGEVRQEGSKYVVGAGKMPLIITEKGKAGVREEYEEMASGDRGTFYCILILGGLLALIFLGFYMYYNA